MKARIEYSDITGCPSQANSCPGSSRLGTASYSSSARRNCRASYEWGHHVAIGLESGLTREEVDRVSEGPEAGWPAPDALLLHAADELHLEQRVSDATWEGLSARYDAQQLIELPMLVGHYHLVAMTLNSLGVEFERDYEDLP
jgi:hypothetical protein